MLEADLVPPHRPEVGTAAAGDPLHDQPLPDLWRLIVETSPSGVLVVDGARRIVLVNRRTEEMFGYPRVELIGQPLEILVPDRLREAHPVHVAAFLAAPEARPMGAGRDLFGRHKDGSEVAIEIGLNPVDAPGGPFTVASIIDITERKRRDDELRRSNAELAQFANIASHDLQEPLRMVASFTELLAQRYKGKLDEKAEKYIFYAVDGARRMQRLINDLLAYSRVGTQGRPMTSVDASAVVDRVIVLLGDAIRSAGAAVHVEPLPRVLADEGQLGQVFQNLIGNAIKFRGTSPPHIRIGATRRGDHWLFAVRDNGIGLDMQHADRIFQMFQRLHERERYEGSGIGLAIARRIVERHGGKLWVESQPGAGATFYFTLLPAPASVPP